MSYRRSTTCAVLSLVVVMAAGPTARALDRQTVLTGYSISSWVEYDGRPIGATRAIVQDSDGYLWLGTETGLLRFDGVRFAGAESLGLLTLPPVPVRALLKGPDDQTLWIGFGEGGGVRRLRNGRVEASPDTLSSSSVTSLAAERDGTIWAATDHGLFAYRNGRWSREMIAKAPPEPIALSVRVSRHGSVLVGTSSGLFERLGAERYERVAGLQSSVRDIDEDAQGRLWTTDPSDGFHAPDEVASVHHRHDAVGVRIVRDRHANIWIGTRGQGLWRIPSGHDGTARVIETATVDTGLVSNGIWDVLEDREGNIWVATQHGVSRLTPHSVKPIVDLGLVHSVEASSDGSVWIGTASGLFNLRSNTAGRVPSRPMWRVSEVRALHEDQAHALWVATDRGPARILGGRMAAVRGRVPGQLAGIRSMAGDGAAGMWFVSGTGELYHWDKTRVSSIATPFHESVSFVYSDSFHRLWVAFQRGRLGIIEADRTFRIFTVAEGLPDGTHATINAISEAPGGTVWIGGTGGLTRFRDGRFVTLARRTGLPGQRVAAAISDEFGNLWLGIDGGIIRLHPDEFEKAVSDPAHKIHHYQFVQADGLAGVTVQSNNEGAARTVDGRLWFVTGRGMTLIDPRAIDFLRIESEPQVRIEGGVADEARFGASNDTRLPASTTRLRIDYTALQLTAPTKTRFRYRLEGFDPLWIEAGTRRQAYYMNLQPRPYRFVVQAADNDGRWIETAASWTFSIQPSFYQTLWFRIVCALGFVVCVWAAWQMRLRGVRQQFAMVLGERARLSREIHDIVLQNLAGVAIQCAGISNSVDPSSPVRAQLDAIRAELENQLREMRQAVWNLRAPILEAYSLPDALREMARRATTDTLVRFELLVSGKPQRLASQLENEVLRIGQEAVTNAVRHASASRVLIHIQFEPRALTLKISDDGSGFHAEHVNEIDGHFGLIGMKERAAQLGGVLRIASIPAGGTEVELIVPSILRFAQS